MKKHASTVSLKQSVFNAVIYSELLIPRRDLPDHEESLKTNSERRSLLMNGRPIYRSVSRPPTLAAASGDTPAVGKRGCTAGADRANKHSRGLARLRVAATGALPQKMKKWMDHAIWPWNIYFGPLPRLNIYHIAWEEEQQGVICTIAHFEKHCCCRLFSEFMLTG